MRPSGPVGRRNRQGLVYATPALLMTVLFFLVPLAGTFYTSLYRWPLYGSAHFAGLANYRFAFGDDRFWSDVLFTVKFAAVTTALGTVLALALALLARRRMRGIGIVRTAFFVPVTVGFAAAGYLWFYLFDSRVGVIDAILRGLHVTSTPVEWLSNGTSAFWAVVIMTLWKSAGFGMVILLVGMQAIPDELYEAFAVDGATRAQSFRFLTLPLLRSNIALVTIMTVVTGMLSFDQFFAMTKGGPDGKTTTAVYDIYQTAFQFQKLGYASSLAMILLVLIVALVAVQLVTVRRRA